MNLYALGKAGTYTQDEMVESSERVRSADAHEALAAFFEKRAFALKHRRNCIAEDLRH
jgi:hypothetical protein